MRAIAGLGMALALALGGCDAADGGSDVKPPSHYLPNCAAGLVAAGHLTPFARGAEAAPADPKILDAGPPVRIQCAYVDRHGDTGAITLDVACGDPLSPGCSRVVALMSPDGRVRYPR